MKKIVNGKEVELSPEEQQKIQAIWDKGEVIRQEAIAQRYRYRRAKEYPKLADQVGAIMKQLSIMRAEGQTMLPEVNELLAEIQAVKDKYPKEG